MLNQANLLGKLKKDPIFNIDKKGIPICSFFLETAEYLYDTGQNATIVEKQAHQIICFGNLARSVGTKLRAGDIVFAQGRIVSNFYIDENNQKKDETNIKLQKFIVVHEFNNE